MNRRSRPDRPKLTIVTPVHNEAENLDAYAREVGETILDNPKLDTTVLFVDDGSSDESWSKIEALCKQSSRFTAIRLSRNFGAHVALAAGIDHADREADMVATLACDLQDPPETVLEFVEAWRRGGDIVWGARRKRKDGRLRQLASYVVEGLLRRFAMPRGSRFRTGSFLLMDRLVAECFRGFREQSRVTFALVAWTGFDQDVVTYDRRARVKGRSGWTIASLIRTTYDVFIGFSAIPARSMTVLGFLIFGTSIIVLLYLIAVWFRYSVQPGWTGIMVTMTFFFGVIFMMLGVIAEYLHRIFLETKGRPLYFVADRVDTQPTENDGG